MSLCLRKYESCPHNHSGQTFYQMLKITRVGIETQLKSYLFEKPKILESATKCQRTNERLNHELPMQIFFALLWALVASAIYVCITATACICALLITCSVLTFAQICFCYHNYHNYQRWQCNTWVTCHLRRQRTWGWICSSVAYSLCNLDLFH